MKSSSIIRLLGLAGAVLTGAASIVAGDPVTGFGIIGAALSSASVFNKKEA